MNRRTFLARGAAVTAAGLAPLGADGAARAARAAEAKPAPRSVPRHAAAPGSALPPKADMVRELRLVADHWIATHTDPGGNNWDNSTFMSGLMALYRLTLDQRYLSYVRGWAVKWNYGLSDGSTTRNADLQCAGQAYLDLYDTAPDDATIKAIETCVHSMTYIDQVNKNDDWSWVDALHMAMPNFARLGALRGDSDYYAKLHRLYTHTKSAEGGPGLYDPASGLWYRDKRFLPGGIQSPNGKPVQWSRGNGWAAAAHTKILKALPAGQADVPEYRAALAHLVTAVAHVQRPDGFWNVNLTDPQDYPGPETSGTAFFVYGTAYAIGAGLVDRTTHLAVAARAWNGLVSTAVHPDGTLGYVQNTGDQPSSSQPVTYNSTTNFGVGGFLLGGTELSRFAQ
jgi:rhamnogalacturonyl hydrolase YesR